MCESNRCAHVGCAELEDLGLTTRILQSAVELTWAQRAPSAYQSMMMRGKDSGRGAADGPQPEGRDGATPRCQSAHHFHRLGHGGLALAGGQARAAHAVRAGTYMHAASIAAPAHTLEPRSTWRRCASALGVAKEAMPQVPSSSTSRMATERCAPGLLEVTYAVPPYPPCRPRQTPTCTR